VTSVLLTIGDPITEGMVPPMVLHPEDDAELDRIYEAKLRSKQQRSEIREWETRVVRRALSREGFTTTQEEVGAKLHVAQEMVYKILRRDDQDDGGGDDAAP